MSEYTANVFMGKQNNDVDDGGLMNERKPLIIKEEKKTVIKEYANPNDPSTWEIL